MAYLLFTIYLVLFCWLINRIGFIRKTGLPAWAISTLFLLKVAAGLAYGWFYTQIPNFEQEADTWKFFLESKQQTNLLLHDPLRYLFEVFENPYGKKYRHLFSVFNSYWNDLKHLYMVKIVSVFNLFSGTRYYVNVIFYSFLTFFGPVAFLRVMNDVFPGRRYLLTAAIFLFPSFLFWSSGIHKDGIVFLFLALSIYIFHFRIKEQTFSIKSILLIVLCILFIFPVRNYVVLALLPAFAAWWLAERYFKQKWIAFLLVSLAGTTAFFGTKYINPKIDLPIAIVMRKQEFIKLGGNSFLPQRELKSTLFSFVQNAPQAINHSLARPYVTEIISPFYLLCALEILFAWMLVFIWFFRFTENPYRHSVVMFCFLVAMVLLLLTGYIVPQLGAIVRYRSIYFPLLMAPIVATIRWKKTY